MHTASNECGHWFHFLWVRGCLLNSIFPLSCCSLYFLLSQSQPIKAECVGLQDIGVCHPDCIRVMDQWFIMALFNTPYIYKRTVFKATLNKGSWAWLTYRGHITFYNPLIYHDSICSTCKVRQGRKQFSWPFPISLWPSLTQLLLLCL